MKTNISSLQNPRIRDLKKLQDKKYRLQQHQFLIEGRRFVEEALRQGASLQTLLYTGEDLLDGLATDGVPEILQVTPQILKELSGTVHPQGIMASVGIPVADPARFEQGLGLWLYLDEIRDPGNLGTIIRSAHAFACDGLILSRGCADPWQDKVLRSTMGSIFALPILSDQDPSYLSRRVGEGVRLYLADLTQARPLAAVTPAPSSIIVIGNEAHGVSDRIRALPHQAVRIPMPGGAESLNAAVAASLFLYEFRGRTTGSES